MKADPNRDYRLKHKPYHYSFTLFEVKKTVEKVSVPTAQEDDEAFEPSYSQMYGLWSSAAKRAEKTVLKEVERVGNDFIFFIRPHLNYSFAILATPGFNKLKMNIYDPKTMKSESFECFASKETTELLFSFIS